MDKITIATFEHKRDNQPRSHNVTWDRLVERLTKHAEREDKDGPLFSPVTYLKGATRGNNRVLTVNLAVADYDHGEDWETVKEQLAAYTYVAYSTYSFTPEDCRFRVVIPFTKPVQKADWPKVKAAIDEHVFRQGSDPAAKDAARLFYLPSCPPGAVRFAEHHEGCLLDPLSLPASDNHKSSPTPASETTGPMKVQLGRTAMDFVANGAPLGEQRARALAAARNYLSAGYNVEDTAAAIWRGFEISPQDPDRGPWIYDDALFIAHNLDTSEAPPLELASPVPPRGEIHRTGLGYICNYPSEGVNVAVDHIYRRSDGVKAEIIVEALTPGVPRNLHWSSFNLSSVTARKALAGYLADRSKGSHLTDDLWKALLEDLCRKVAFAEREGEPPVRVGNLPDEDIPTWLVRNAILNSEIGTVYGPGSCGKSRFLLALGLSVKTGITFVPGFTPMETGEIYYLDWETERSKINRRIKQLCRGKNMTFVEILYQKCRSPMAEIYEKVLKDIEKHDVKLVIVDSVEAATTGTREAGADQNAAVMALYEALRKLGVTVVLIDHVNSVQARETKGPRKPYGSIFKYNYARYAFELRQATDSKEPGDEHLALYCTKYNDDIMPKPVGIRVRFDSSKTTYEAEKIESSELVEGLTHAERIKTALDAGPMTIQELQETTGIAANAVRSTISRNKAKFTKAVGGSNPKWGNLSPF